MGLSMNEPVNSCPQVCRLYHCPSCSYQLTATDSYLCGSVSKQSFNFTFYWHVSQIGTFLHVKQPYRNPCPPQHTAPSLSFSLSASWRSSPLLLRKILHSLYYILKCRPMVKDGLEFTCFFYSCILLPEIVIQNSWLLMSRGGGIKHSIQGSELPPKTATRDPG